MLKVRLVGDNRLQIGERFTVTFQRTLRIPDDGGNYPLPPGLGAFPILRVEDFSERVPDAWRERGGYIIPMYQREALWLSFEAAHWKPNAVKVGIGRINAVTGEGWNEELHAEPEQDYIVCPDQPWLDGINAGDGYIRQFVAMPLGQGYTVEGQLTGKEEFGGIQLVAFEPKPGKFPDEPPKSRMRAEGAFYAMSAAAPAPMMEASGAGFEMGLGAGGKMTQKIYPDPHGLGTWDQDNYGTAFVHIVNSEQFAQLTGQPAPPSPVSAQLYTQYGYPWFELYDERQPHLAASEKLGGVKSIKEKDLEKDLPAMPEDNPVEIGEEQIKKLEGKSSAGDERGQGGDPE
jgi:hypothetical protein